MVAVAASTAVGHGREVPLFFAATNNKRKPAAAGSLRAKATARAVENVLDITFINLYILSYPKVIHAQIAP
jgi:hypothetical protein